MRSAILYAFLALFATTSLFSQEYYLPPKKALAELKQGNKRFAKTQISQFTSNEQGIPNPSVLIITTSDISIPIDLIFDQKVGTLKTISSRTPLPSLQNQIVSSHPSLVVVLGQDSIGGKNRPTPETAPQVTKISKSIENLVVALRQTPALAKLQKRQRLCIVGACLNAPRGDIEWYER